MFYQFVLVLFFFGKFAVLLLYFSSFVSCWFSLAGIVQVDADHAGQCTGSHCFRGACTPRPLPQNRLLCREQSTGTRGVPTKELRGVQQLHVRPRNALFPRENGRQRSGGNWDCRWCDGCRGSRCLKLQTKSLLTMFRCACAHTHTQTHTLTPAPTTASHQFLPAAAASHHNIGWHKSSCLPAPAISPPTTDILTTSHLLPPRTLPPPGGVRRK